MKALLRTICITPAFIRGVQDLLIMHQRASMEANNGQNPIS